MGWLDAGAVAMTIAEAQSNAERLPITTRDKYLRKKFGITEAQYNAILEAQGGVCAVCKKPNKGNRAMPVDHDHKTGKVRGIVCFIDNNRVLTRGITAERLRAAAEYLDNNPADQILGVRQ
jgi:recombination endonuclease VII